MGCSRPLLDNGLECFLLCELVKLLRVVVDEVGEGM